MPEGQPYPPPSASATQATTQGGAAPTPTLGALQAFAGQGTSTQFQHNSFLLKQLPPRLATNVRATRFEATGLVIDNQSASPIYVGVGRRPGFDRGAYDYRVAPGGVLIAHTFPTTTFWLLNAGQHNAHIINALPGAVDVYLLGGSIAAFLPPFSHTVRPGYATVAVATVTVSTTTPRSGKWIWTHTLTAPKSDPFTNYPVLLDRVIVAGTHGTVQSLAIPTPFGAGPDATPLLVPVSYANPVVDVGGAVCGAGAPRTTPTQETHLTGAPPNGEYQFSFVYRLIGPANTPSTPVWATTT